MSSKLPLCYLGWTLKLKTERHHLWTNKSSKYQNLKTAGLHSYLDMPLAVGLPLSVCSGSKENNWSQASCCFFYFIFFSKCVFFSFQQYIMQFNTWKRGTAGLCNVPPYTVTEICETFRGETEPSFRKDFFYLYSLLTTYCGCWALLEGRESLLYWHFKISAW